MNAPATYPPVPVLAPRAAGETAEAYGRRALLFVTAERITLTVDREGLDLAAHAYRLAVCNRDLTTAGAERLAEVNRMICAALRRRDAEDAESAPAAAPAPALPAAGADSPRQGPGAPLRPAPVRPTPPAGGATLPHAGRPAPVPAYVPPVRLSPVGALQAAAGAEELF